MISEAVKQRFEAIVRSGEGDPAALAKAAKQGDMKAAADLGALFARAGFVEPATILDVYDAAACGWFGDASPSVSLRGGSGTVNPALWHPFWDFLDDDTKMDAGGFHNADGRPRPVRRRRLCQARGRRQPRLSGRTRSREPGLARKV